MQLNCSFKIIILTLITCFTNSSTLFSQGESPEVVKKYFKLNDKEKMKLDAGIKKCIEIRFTAGRTDTTRISYYNNTGKLQQEYMPADDQNLNLWSQNYYSYFYQYDNYGKIIQRIDSLLPHGEVKKNLLTYDDIGNLIKEEQKTESLVKTEINYDYDPMGRVIEASTKDAVNNCKVSEKYLYNTYNDLARSLRKDNCGDGDDRTLTVNYTYKYNKLALITEKISIFSSGNTLTETYKYDDKGAITEAYMSTSPDNYTKYVYTYDAGGKTQIVEITEIKNSNINKSIRTINYDKFGNKLEEIYMTEDQKENYRTKLIYE
ncbi:MAG: hypothetical protein K8I03_10595 [Ignavibacteria bacterium]|nr:hypothetical protein [Ignavibacteria bacterium]